MPFCSKCGASLADGAQFCSSCGAPCAGGAATSSTTSNPVGGYVAPPRSLASAPEPSPQLGETLLGAKASSFEGDDTDLPELKVHPRQSKYGTCPVLFCAAECKPSLLEIGPPCCCCPFMPCRNFHIWSPKNEAREIMALWGEFFSPLAKDRKALQAKKSFMFCWSMGVVCCIIPYFWFLGGPFWTCCCFKMAGCKESKDMSRVLFCWTTCCGYERRYPGVKQWLADRAIDIGDKVQWMFHDDELPKVHDRMGAKEIAQEAMQAGLKGAAKSAGKEIGKEIVQSVMGGQVHPQAIAQSCIKGCLKACFGDAVDNCYPVETKYVGEVIGFVDDDTLVRFHGRGVWRYKKNALMMVEKCAEDDDSGSIDWREAWREERSYESLSLEERESLSNRRMNDKATVTKKQAAVQNFVRC
eukprot:SAG31_NODE_664_length_12996_cov_4.853997_6_plen_413_part_00